MINDEIAAGAVDPYQHPPTTVRTRYMVRVTRADGVVIFDGLITDHDRFTLREEVGKSTTVDLTATAAIEGLTVK